MSGWNKSSKSILQNLALISQVGIMMLVPILGGVLLGAFLDQFFKTGGIFLIIFVLIGVGTSFRNLYMLSIRQTRDYTDSENPSTYVNNYEKKIQEEKKEKENKNE